MNSQFDLNDVMTDDDDDGMTDNDDDGMTDANVMKITKKKIGEKLN